MSIEIREPASVSVALPEDIGFESEAFDAAVNRIKQFIAAESEQEGGGVLFEPLALIINAEEGFHTVLNKAAWDGLAVLRVDEWCDRKQSYITFAAPIVSPSWFEVAVTINNFLHFAKREATAAEQNFSQHPRSCERLLTEVKKSPKSLSEFGDLPVFTAYFERAP